MTKEQVFELQLKAVAQAIKAIGLDTFKKTSFFASNDVKFSHVKRAA